MEGVVPPGMFKTEHKTLHPIVIGVPTQSGGKADSAEAMDEDEKKQIMEQLQMLGYME
jgi:hypothetical protein